MLRNLIVVLLAYVGYLLFRRFLSNRGRRKPDRPKQNGSARSSKKYGQAVDADFEDIDD